jgi:hypothetical protein
MESLQPFSKSLLKVVSIQCEASEKRFFWARDTQVMPNFNRFFTHDFEFGVET